MDAKGRLLLTDLWLGTTGQVARSGGARSSLPRSWLLTRGARRGRYRTQNAVFYVLRRRCDEAGDGTARHGYGREVHRWCGFRCAYCDLDLGSFEGWLQLSIDHVVPQQMAKVGWPKQWLLDKANIVACCMACNGLFNRDPAVGDPPVSWEGFLAVRDEMFKRRRARILERRQVERTYFETENAPTVSAPRHPKDRDS